MLTKTILVFCYNLLSHYLGCITFANKYKKYTVLFVNSEKHDDVIKRAGFKSFTVETFNSE